KLLEGALIKVSAVASKLTTVSAQDMIKAMIGGQRDPHILAGLARGRMKAKHDALVEALTGMFDDHHGELAQMLLDQIAFCDTRIAALATRIEQHLAQVRDAWGVDADGSTGPAAGAGPEARGGRRCASSGFGCRPACRARPGGRGSRRRLPCGPCSATTVPTPLGTGAGQR